MPRIGRISRILTPTYSGCLKCHTTWFFVEPHITSYDEHNGCFALCKQCREELTPTERLPYYRTLWVMWDRDSCAATKRWQDIETAVMAGM